MTSLPNLNNLRAIDLHPKIGNEFLRNGQKDLPIALINFWRWSASNVLGNALRGQLAEFIVGYALDCLSTVRQEWDAYDLKKDNLRIEVKSASYLQSWKQEKPSSIGFDIAPKRGWDAASNTMGAEECRASEAYVFCLLHHAEKVSVDPLDLSQWSFYVVPTRWLDQQFPKQQRLSLAALQKIQSKSLTFDELRDQFHQFATIGKTEDA